MQAVPAGACQKQSQICPGPVVPGEDEASESNARPRRPNSFPRKQAHRLWQDVRPVAMIHPGGHVYDGAACAECDDGDDDAGGSGRIDRHLLFR